MKLSPRLAEAKRLLDECRPPREVARLMGVSIRTLREYQKRIQEGGYGRGQYRQFRSYAIAQRSAC